MEKIYFDYASTTPADPEVIAAMMPFFTEKFGNASSPHSFGLEAQKALEDSREILAKFLGVSREEMVFTSGGTEANNLAIIGVARRLKSKGNHIITTKIEHPSVLETAQYLEKEGFRVTYLDVDENGLISLEELQKAISEQTILVSIMHASNEIGTLEPIDEIGKITREKGIFFHVDAVQTIGHLPVSVKDLNIDLLSLAAHKLYGPKGIGALYVRKGVQLASQLLGGNQEHGLRASTQNVAGVVGLAKAIEICSQRITAEAAEQMILRNYLITQVLKRIDGSRLNGSAQNRLPNNAHFAFENIRGEALLMSLDMVGIAASMGSACKAGTMEPSHVLKAIGLSDDLAFGALRISIGRWTTREQIEYLLEQLPKAIRQLRK
ncbi:MAG: cysteine desulfurase [Candidatus Omnitrophica bacterium]|nr:cysteine desulfurase [Candidatus Omnitrophota bacterium]